MGESFFDVVVEAGSAPHLMVLTTHPLDDDRTLGTALEIRFNSGAANASTLEGACLEAIWPRAPRPVNLGRQDRAGCVLVAPVRQVPEGDRP